MPHEPRYRGLLTRRRAFWGGVAGAAALVPPASRADDTATAFQLDGAGSSRRTVQAKLKELPSLDDFGPVGDGVTDDWQRLQAALDWAGSRPGTRLRVPPRVFAVSRPLLVPQSIELAGEVYGDGNIPLSGFRALKGFETTYAISQLNADKKTRTEMPVAAVLLSKGWSTGASFGRRVHLRDLYIDVGEVTERRGGPVHGIMLSNQQLDLQDIWIRSATGFGVWINTQLPDGNFTGALVDNVLRRVWIRGAGVGGATFETGSGKFRYGGILIGALPGAKDSTGKSEPALATDGIMDYCTVAVGPEAKLGCRGNGIHITRSAGWRVTSCHLNGAGRHGIVAERSFQTEVSGCYIDGWGVDAEENEGEFGAVWCNAMVGLDDDVDGGLIVSSNRISCRPVKAPKGNQYAAISLRAGTTPTARAVVSGNVLIKRRNVSQQFAILDFGRAKGGALEAMVTGNMASGATDTFLGSWDEADVRPRFSGNSFQFASGSPKAGWFPRGLKIENAVPAAGGLSGWVCVAGGAPGKWRGYGKIES